MLIGAVTVVAWKNLGTPLYEIVPGFVACGIVAIVVSLLDKPKDAVVERFIEADKAYKVQL